MNETDTETTSQDEYIESTRADLQQTVDQFAGADGPALAAALASVFVAFVREVFERLAVVERALSLVDTSIVTRQVPMAPVEVVIPPSGPVPSQTLEVQHVPSAPSFGEDPLIVRAAPASQVPSLGAAEPAAKLDQIRQLEAMLAALRGQPSAASAPTSGVRYEVRHADGSLAKHVPDSLRVHPTREAAEHAQQMIEATHPGWRFKLSVEEIGG